MNLQKKFFIVLVSISFLIPTISANLLITMESDHGNNPSLSLNHGKSETIIFKINNPNTFCSIQCSWSLIKQETIEVSAGTRTIQTGYLLSLPLTFTAPTKDCSTCSLVK